MSDPAGVALLLDGGREEGLGSAEGLSAEAARVERSALAAVLAGFAPPRRQGEAGPWGEGDVNGEALKRRYRESVTDRYNLTQTGDRGTLYIEICDHLRRFGARARGE